MTMKSETHSWIENVRGETRRELAEAVSRVAGLLPDNAVIVDDDGAEIGKWSSVGFSHSPSYGKPSIFFFDNRRGSEYLWHTERSEAVCLSE